jgi:glycosyltransferase involved in cell wall biosynthesis
MQIPLILVSNHLKPHEQNGAESFDDSVPRQDYTEIARALGGKLSGYNLSRAAWYRWTRQLEKEIKLDLVEAAFAAYQVASHNVLLSTSEKTAIPLALLLSLFKQETPHIMIAHKLSSGFKAHLWQKRQLHQKFSQIICLSQAQADYAIHHLNLPEERVHFIYDKVDHNFFRPMKADADDYILAVGQEQRDYQTLLQAIAGTGLKLVVVASSPWSTSKVQLDELGKVTVLSHIPYSELRMLYARARLVVVPLFEVDYAAGVNAVLEAMAMAKPVIVSRTRGIADYIAPNETGIYVPSGDPAELNRAILSLWTQPGELSRLGVNARQAVEESMNLDIYVNRVVEIVRKAATS